MKTLLRLLAITACLGLGLVLSAQNLGQTTTPSQNSLSPDQIASLLQNSLMVSNSSPAPADDPLLDVNGNVVMDANGNPESDPNETFHTVKPQEFDPGHTDLVQAAWLNGTGCPTNATVANSNSTGTGIASFSTFTDPACATADPKDQHNEGLLLVKTGPTTNFASATAELKKVRGITLTELGYDIRKPGITVDDPRGSHCGAGAPRFLVIMQNGTAFVIGCNSPPPAMDSFGTGWQRLRWGGSPGTLIGFSSSCGTPAGSCPVVGTVSRIIIIFDEGQDPSGGPDQFGGAFLDNIDVNGMLVGQGPTDAD